MAPEFRAKLVRQGHFALQVVSTVAQQALAFHLFAAGSRGYALCVAAFSIGETWSYLRAAEWNGPRVDKWSESRRERMRLALAMYDAAEMMMQKAHAKELPK